MYSKEVIAEHGVTPEKIKPLAEKLSTDRESPFAKWIQEQAQRIQDGIDQNLKNWRLYWALDQAYDAPFHQVSYTLLRDLIEKDYDDEKVLSMAEEFGVTNFMEPVLDAEGKVQKTADGKTKTALNVPVFFEMFVPLCAAYLKARWSKLFNDRNLIPFYKYEPSYSTKKNRLRCEIITSRVSQMTSQFGYTNDERDSIFQALHYGQSIAFPREAWYREYKLDENGKEVVDREGLRFNMPTPERVYADQSERISTLNSQSGVRFIGNWHITPLSTIQKNDWWNKDKISYGNHVNIITANPNFFSNIYPCTIQFPTGTTSTEANDREITYDKYASSDGDKAVILTEHFCTAVPKDIGIGDYPYPVNFRLVMMNYDTPAYIEPIFCGLGAYYGYDGEGNRVRNSSLTLEVLPFQDQIGNILTQWILSAKQNLTSVTFVDSDVVPKEAIDAVKNLGEKRLRNRQLISYSSREMAAKIGETRSAFESPVFPMLQTGEMRTLISGLLDLLERALQFSSQEIGQAASHEQSATESNIIQSNTGNRVQFTGTFIDDGIWAKKKMYYEALMANSDDDVWAEVYPNYTETYKEFEALCKELDIEIVDRAGMNGEKVVIKTKAKNLTIDSFVSNRDAANRVNNQAVAASAVQLLQAVANNPMIAEAIGPNQLVELTNHVASMLQLPNDFRLKALPNAGTGNQSEQAQQVQEAMKQMAEDIGKRIEQGEKGLGEAIQQGDEGVAKAISGEVGNALQERDKALEGMAKEIQQIGQAVQGMIQAAQQAQNTPPPMVPPTQ